MAKKSKLHVTIIPDVFYCCCTLQNLIICRGVVDIEDLMCHIVLEAEQEVMS